jgi:LacI family transcriptional regulator
LEKLTIDQIAEMAFVSRSVVSRVLNNHSNVSAEARARVMQVVNQYNYTPNRAARSLVTNRSFEISVLVPRKDNELLANGFWSLLLAGITETCNSRGYLVSLSMISDRMEAEIRNRILSRSNFDGFIVVGDQVASLATPAIRERNSPAVMIGCRRLDSEVSHIDAGNVSGAERAVEHLIGLGHRRIAVITGTMNSHEARDRMAGYLQALRRHGIAAPRELQAEGDYSEQSGYEAMKRLLALKRRPTGVFCMCDALALGAILAVHDAGLTVPGDVSVVGYDDLPFARFTIPPLTTIHQPIFALGGLAARTVIQEIECGRMGPSSELLGARLVVRGTTGPPPSAA